MISFLDNRTPVFFGLMTDPDPVLDSGAVNGSIYIQTNAAGDLKVSMFDAANGVWNPVVVEVV